MSASHTSHDENATHKATMNGLAIIGFIGLVIAGMLLAVYASRYVPDALSRLSSAVYLSSDRDTTTEEETPVEEEPAPSNETPVVVPQDDTKEEPKPVTGGPQIVTPPVAVSPNPPQVITTTSEKPLYGRADLTLSSVRVGYFRGSTFVEDNEVPDGRDLALKFTVRNTGTNSASGWRIRVNIEGERTAIGNGALLYPDGTQSFTLRATNPEEGNNREISIEVDYQDRVDESNERNNDRELEIDVERD